MYLRNIIYKKKYHLSVRVYLICSENIIHYNSVISLKSGGGVNPPWINTEKLSRI